MTGLRIAVLRHEPETGLGTFAALLDRARVDYHVVETLGGALPEAGAFDGTIALGGSLNVYDPRLLETRRWIRNSVLRGLPFLGVCLGGQLLASALGAVVERQARPEVGVHDVYLTDAAEHDPLFSGLPGRFAVFGWHEDCFGLPPRAVPLAGSIACTYQAFRFGAGAYGLQFHSEVRPDDLGAWATVPGYRKMLDRAGAEADVMRDLERIAPALDSLAGQLLGRWLHLVSGIAAVERLGVAF
ncbi:MAG: type 1 glutamine amidotransferase [Gaiellaceae bacterium]